MRKKLLALLLALSMVFALAACSGNGGAASDQPSDAVSETPSQEPSDAPSEKSAAALDAAEIQVFIAASLENAFKDLIALYNETQPNVTVTYNADSSGTLLTQIEEGYECDIFFSAATKQMKSLEEDGLVMDGTRVDLLRNEVVLITWKGSGTKVTGIENIADAASIALADGSVPVGKYTRVALQNLGVLDKDADPSGISTEDVSAALGGVEINECGNVSKVKEAVKEGSNEVGTVYYSDAYSVRDDVDIIEHISTDLTGDIVYPMCRVTNAEADDAQTAAADDFFAFLQTPEAMAIFEEYMFVSNNG
jgi:molybdate transport system substrate-binding protein